MDQFVFLQSMKKDYDLITNNNVFTNYNENNLFFSISDAIEYSMMISKLNFNSIIEIGCGNSTFVLNDVNCFLNKNINVILIDPNPRSDISNIVKAKHINKKVQECGIDIKNNLDSNDLLFIDSSHIYENGSDCQYLIDDVIPNLKPNTFIYFHDIFWPMEYPQNWPEGRTISFNWNEIYFVKKMIDMGDIVDVVLHTPKVFQENEQWVKQNMPKLLDPPFLSGGIWLRKI